MTFILGVVAGLGFVTLYIVSLILNRIYTMPTNQDIRNELGELKSAVATEMEQVNTKLDELRNADGAEKEAIIADIREITARVSGIIPDEPTEEPPAGDGEDLDDDSGLPV